MLNGLKTKRKSFNAIFKCLDNDYYRQHMNPHADNNWQKNKQKPIQSKRSNNKIVLKTNAIQFNFIVYFSVSLHSYDRMLNSPRLVGWLDG